jgi:hypothetical protein
MFVSTRAVPVDWVDAGASGLACTVTVIVCSSERMRCLQVVRLTSLIQI